MRKEQMMKTQGTKNQNTEIQSAKKAEPGILENVLRLAPAVLAVVAVALLFVLPFATYQYKQRTYGILGRSFLFGTRIAGGRHEVGQSTVLWIFVVSMAVVLVSSLIKFRKRVVSEEIMTVAGIAGLVSSAFMASNVAGMLEGVKKTAASTGAVASVVLSILVIVCGLYALREHKVLCSLDFMVLPGLLYFIINNYIPMFGIYIAFKKIDYSKGLWGSDWVGFDNFKYLFSTTDAWVITRNTLLYNAAFIVLGIVSGLVVGICLSEVARKAMQKFYQTSILLPQLISFVIVSYIVYALLSNETGLITKALGSAAPNFYADKTWWPFILIFINVWKQLGYNGIIFLSSIVGIDYGIYEAARVDGATRWQMIWKITIPQLKPTIMTLFLLQVGRIFYSDFGLFNQVPLNAGALYDVTNTIDTYVYRALMVNNNISLASAASTYQAIVGFAIVLVVNLIVRKVDKENAMF